MSLIPTRKQQSILYNLQCPFCNGSYMLVVDGHNGDNSPEFFCKCKKCDNKLVYVGFDNIDDAISDLIDFISLGDELKELQV